MPVTAAIAAVAELISKVFGFVVDPEGYDRLSRENKLKLIQRGIDVAITNDDWASCDALFAQLRELRTQSL